MLAGRNQRINELGLMKLSRCLEFRPEYSVVLILKLKIRQLLKSPGAARTMMLVFFSFLDATSEIGLSMSL